MSAAPEPHLEHLYQEVILDHNKSPRNFRALEDANRYSHGVNPLCGDDYHLYLKVDDKGVIQEVGFQGQGCAISKSSASILTTLIKGQSVADAEELRKAFMHLMLGEAIPEIEKTRLKRLRIFEGVKEFPVRVKCATLIWHALEDALK